MEDSNNCPKPGCARPESTHRYSAGKRLSVCGNGHSWDAVEVAAQRQKAEEAKRSEDRIEVKIFRSPLDYEDIKRRYFDGGSFSGGSFR